MASLFTGFIAAFERSAVEAIGDIVMRAPEGIRFEKYPEFIERLEHSDLVEAATASLTAEGLLRIEGGNVRPVAIWGIEPGPRARVVGLKNAPDLPGEGGGRAVVSPWPTPRARPEGSSASPC